MKGGQGIRLKSFPMPEKRHTCVSSEFTVVVYGSYIQKIEFIRIRNFEGSILTGIVCPIRIEKGENQHQSKRGENEDFQNLDQLRGEYRIS
jgi:hypothetical protein